MGFTPNTPGSPATGPRRPGGIRRAACIAAVPLIVTAWIIVVPLRTGPTVHAGPASPAAGRTIVLGTASAGAAYAVTVSVKDPAQLQGIDAVHVVVNDAQGEVESKWLHAADLDFYLTLRPRGCRPGNSETLRRLPACACPDLSHDHGPDAGSPKRGAGAASNPQRGVIAAAPNSTWQTAQPFELGRTIFGSDDERPYAPSKSEDALRGHGEGIPVVPVHVPREPAKAGLFRSKRHRSRRPARCRHLPGRERLRRKARRGSVHRWRVCLQDRGHAELSRPVQIPHPHPPARTTNTTCASPPTIPPGSCTPMSTACRPIRIRTRPFAPAWISW